MLGVRLAVPASLIAIMAAAAFFYTHQPAGTLWIDFAEYWASARLLLEGENPYDAGMMAALQRASTDAPETVLMWNPPLVFPFTAPLGAVDFKFARVIWLLLSCGLMSWVAVRSIWENFKGERLFARCRLPAILYTASFPGFMYCFVYGQISPLLMLGFWLFWTTLDRRDARGAILGGLALSLTLLKPQLLYLTYLSLLLNWRKAQNRYALLGLAGGFAFLASAAWALSDQVWQQYLAAMSSPPLYWKTPSLGSLVQGISGIADTAIRSLPAAVCALVLCSACLWRGLGWGKGVVSMTAAVSVFCSPYAWTYDLAILFPVFLWAVGRAVACRGESLAARMLIVAAVAGNFAALLIPGDGMHELVWYPALGVLLTFGAWRLDARRASTLQV